MNKNPRPETVEKYLKILQEVSKHDTIYRKEIRKIVRRHKASHMVVSAMFELNYITSDGRKKLCQVHLKSPEPFNARMLAIKANSEKHPKSAIDYQTLDPETPKSTLLTREEAFEFIEHRIAAHIDHHVSLAHQSLIKSWFKKNQAAILSTAITVLVIAAIIAAFLLGKSL